MMVNPLFLLLPPFSWVKGKYGGKAHVTPMADAKKPSRKGHTLSDMALKNLWELLLLIEENEVNREIS